MSKKVENEINEKEKKDGIQKEMSSVDHVSNVSTDIESKVEGSDEVLDLDNELLKVNCDLKESVETAETIVIPEITAEEIIKAKKKSGKTEKDAKDSSKDKSAKKNTDSKNNNNKKADSKKSAENKSKSVNNGVKKAAGSKKTSKKKKKLGVPAICGIVLGSVVAIAGCTYAGFAMYFGNHYFYNTTINGADFSCKTVEDAKAYMEDKVSNYELMIEESDGTSETIYGSDFDIKFASSDELQKILDSQNQWKFLSSISNTSDYTTEVAVTFDEAKFEANLKNLVCMDEEHQKKSKNAYPEFDEEAGKYVIHPEEIGTKIEEETLISVIKDAVYSFEDSVNLEENGCYTPPKYTTESEKIQKCTKSLNKYLKAEITYDFDPEKEVVDASVIKDWLSYNKKYKVKFDEDAVREYIENLAINYNTVGKERTFTTGNGGTATVSGGSYGFAIDKETEYKNLIANIKNGDVITREPAYYQRGVSHGDNDFGSTFAEVNLTTQHMYYVQNGETVMESDVVTGIPVNGHATPEGVYSVAWMQSPSVLKGENDDGSKYKTKVQYWMAFNYDIGFHDASWQPTFGGDRYTYGGSHGCVNMPTDAAGQLYKLISNGTPVVVHF